MKNVVIGIIVSCFFLIALSACTAMPHQAEAFRWYAEQNSQPKYSITPTFAPTYNQNPQQNFQQNIRKNCSPQPYRDVYGSISYRVVCE